MSKTRKAFPLRLDPELYRALEKWANDEFRSVNAHIEYLLREALRKSGRLHSVGKTDDDPDNGSAPTVTN